jgi:hypothetical protein
MIRKGKAIKFRKSGTIMERVYQAVLDGNTAKMRIVVATSLPYQKVSTALYALTFCGNLVAVREGKVFRYSLPGDNTTLSAQNFNELQRIFYAGCTEK